LSRTKLTYLAFSQAGQTAAGDASFVLDFGGTEDFSYFQKIIPGFFWFLGVRNEKLGITGAHHTPEFDIDEAALLPGLKLASNQLLDYLERHR